MNLHRMIPPDMMFVVTRGAGFSRAFTLGSRRSHFSLGIHPLVRTSILPFPPRRETQAKTFPLDKRGNEATRAEKRQEGLVAKLQYSMELWCRYLCDRTLRQGLARDRDTCGLSGRRFTGRASEELGSTYLLNEKLRRSCHRF